MVHVSEVNPPTHPARALHGAGLASRPVSRSCQSAVGPGSLYERSGTLSAGSLSVAPANQASARLAHSFVPNDAAREQAMALNVASSSSVGGGTVMSISRSMMVRTVLRTVLSNNCCVSFISLSIEFSWRVHCGAAMVKERFSTQPSPDRGRVRTGRSNERAVSGAPNRGTNLHEGSSK